MQWRGIYILTSVDFSLFHFFLCFFRLVRVLMTFFSSSVRSRFLRPSIISYFFHQVFFLSWSRHHCDVPLRPTMRQPSLQPFHFLAGDQLMVPTGVTHISLPLHQIQSREQEKKTPKKQTNKRLGLTQVQKESYVTLCMCRLTLVWTLAKLPQSYWNADSIFFHWSGPSLCCPMSIASLRRPSPTANFELLFHTLFPRPLPTTGHVRSPVQNPLSGFVPKQTKESSAWRATYIVLHCINMRTHHLKISEN